MARGNKKSTALKATAIQEDVSEAPGVPGSNAVKASFSPKDETELLGFITKYKSDPKKLKAIEDFSDKLQGYTGKYQVDYSSSYVKKMRSELAKSFIDLPEDVRAYLSAPREKIKELYRGATHPSNPGPDGKINASFSTNKKLAEGFLEKQAEMMENGLLEEEYPKPWTKVYTATDIKSFDHIIDVSKGLRIKSVMQYDYYVSQPGVTPEKANFEGKYLNESEFIVTNIKWNRV